MNQKGNQIIAKELMNECIGPEPLGNLIKINTDSISNQLPYSKVMKCSSNKSDHRHFFIPFRTLENFECLSQNPLSNYFVGMLQPKVSENEDTTDEDITLPDSIISNPDSESSNTRTMPSFNNRNIEEESGIDEQNLEKENQIKNNQLSKSSMSIIFSLKNNFDNEILIKITGKIYKKCKLSIYDDSKESTYNEKICYFDKISDSDKKERMYYIEEPIEVEEKLIVNSSDVIFKTSTSDEIILSTKYSDYIKLKLKIIKFPNNTESSNSSFCIYIENLNEKVSNPISPIVDTLFQTKMELIIQSNDKFQKITQPKNKLNTNLNYPDYDLLYNKKGVFSLGNGCSAEWNADGTKIWTESMPLYEHYGFDHIPLKIPIKMSDLSQLDDNYQSEGWKSLYSLVVEYKEWLSNQSSEISKIDDNNLTKSALLHLEKIKEFILSIESGIEFLKFDKIALSSFKFANEAMLSQQKNYRGKEVIKFKQFNKDFKPEWEINEIKPFEELPWYPFQIAFILSTIKSSVDPIDPDRELVDLIWFPTGGGKTEAYLGLIAFACFYRRMKSPLDKGTSVITRYTYRLLTYQQFERTSSLICSMEIIRRKNIEIFGKIEFSIGIWVGDSSLPNTRQEAIKRFDKFKEESRSGTPWVISACPWCKIQMGFFSLKNNSTLIPLGIQKVRNTIVLSCPDPSCDFNERLPLKFIDEDIYLDPPTVIIGTVDKFAAISMFNKKNSPVKRIFGFNDQGEREEMPPNLVIQDEFHLISGPLGTIVGYFEILIEKLLSYELNNRKIKPKIVCSTATIKSFEEQIKLIFGRTKSRLCPPPGISISDSFFAKESKKSSKLFLGIMPHNRRSTQDLYGKLVAKILNTVKNRLPNEEMKNYYWTLISYFNSINQLSTSSGTLNTDYGNHKDILWRKYANTDKPYITRDYNPHMEITSRAKSEDIPMLMEQLATNYNKDDEYGSIAVCSASNIIEVGLDIQRLSLMMVNKPPKSLSQYVQVTGRIGRNLKFPGLVVFYLDQNRPRDVSIYETFKSFHDRIYSDIEVTSVTPFSDQVVQRVTASLMISYARTRYPNSSEDFNFKYQDQIVKCFYDIKEEILDRAKFIELNEINLNRLEKSIDIIIDKLKKQINKLKSNSEHKAKWQSTRLEEGLFYFMDNKPDQNTSVPVITSARNITEDAQGYGVKDLTEWEGR